MPHLIECSCGHQGTVPDQLVGKEIQCPKCHKLLVPLTADKMDNFAAKVLFASPGAQPDEPDNRCPDGSRRYHRTGNSLYLPDVRRAAYQVKRVNWPTRAIICRNCREPLEGSNALENRSEPPSKKKLRERRTKVAVAHLSCFTSLSGIFYLIIGISARHASCKRCRFRSKPFTGSHRLFNKD